MGGLHPLEQLGGGKGQHLLRMVLFRGKAEAEAEHLLFGYMLVEQGVMTLYGLFLFLVKPASFAGQKLRLELGVQLLMLYGGGAVYGVLQTDTEETALTGTVYQQIFPGAGADERGDTGKCRSTAFVGLADIQCGCLHQVL